MPDRFKLNCYQFEYEYSFNHVNFYSTRSNFSCIISYPGIYFWRGAGKNRTNYQTPTTSSVSDLIFTSLSRMSMIITLKFINIKLFIEVALSEDCITIQVHLQQWVWYISVIQIYIYLYIWWGQTAALWTRETVAKRAKTRSWEPIHTIVHREIKAFCHCLLTSKYGLLPSTYRYRSG